MRINHRAQSNDHQILWGAAIVLSAAFLGILGSKLGLGLLSIFPLFLLFPLFFKHYELGLVCYVLSFSYQAPVVFVPTLGLSAVIRLDELVFAALFPAWLLRGSIRQSLLSSKVPLAKPLLFYALVAFLSLVIRYDAISSTAFVNTATGFKGLGILVFKLAETVGGYFILADSKTTEKTRKNLFTCLPVVAAIAVSLGFLISHGMLPKDILRDEIYDPQSWYTRFSLFGNTSAWGVLLITYFMILLYFFLSLKSTFMKIYLFVGLIICVDQVLISGTKTSIVLLGLGLILVSIIESRKKNLVGGLKVALIVFGIITIGFLSIDRFATEEQKKDIYANLGEAYIGAGTKGTKEIYQATSLGSRYDHWFRFANAVEEEPLLLVLGRGWHRRSMYAEGVSLHNDLLTGLHDLGIPGMIFVLWTYLAMFRQFFSPKNRGSTPSSTEVTLRSIMQILAILLFISSFTGENLTLYWEIDVQFPFIAMLMAVTWQYLKQTYKGMTNVYLQKENIYR